MGNKEGHLNSIQSSAQTSGSSSNMHAGYNEHRLTLLALTCNLTGIGFILRSFTTETDYLFRKRVNQVKSNQQVTVLNHYTIIRHKVQQQGLKWRRTKMHMCQLRFIKREPIRLTLKNCFPDVIQNVLT